MSHGDGYSSTPSPFVDARELRRQLGPMASAVLADILDDARPDDGGKLVVFTNVRRLAANLGVSKDTAARALRRLAALGLVEAIPARRAERGRFGRACYRIHRRDGVVVCDVRRLPAGQATVEAAPARPSARTPAPELSLFHDA